MIGCWVLGVGCEAGSPRGPTLKGRWVALPPPVSRRPGWYTSLDLAAAPHLTAAAPRGEGTRATSRRLPPKHPAGSQHPPYRKIPRSGRKFFGRWMVNFGRWVPLRIWALGGTDHPLGVGWRWMPLAKALGGVRARREATARSALMRAPAGSSRPRKVDGGGIGHPGSGGV